MRKKFEYVYCDSCGKEIKDSFLEIDYKGAHLDYCEDCADKMIFGVTDKQAKMVPEQKAQTCCAPAPESGVSVAGMDEEAEDEKKITKGGFDYGKAQALRDAGWTIKQISDEMGFSEITIGKWTHPGPQKKRKPLEFGG